MALKLSGEGADDLTMNNESMSFEEQFAAFNGQAPQWEPAPEEPAVSVATAPEPEPMSLEPFTPAAPPATVEHAVPAVEPTARTLDVDEPATDVLLAELDKATASLAAFRQEIGRVVGQQRSTEAELQEARVQLAHLEGQTKDSSEYARLESELAHQRELVANMRAKLGELFSSLELS